MHRLRLSLHLALSVLLLAGAAHVVETPDFEKTVKPFFTEHCFKCHDAKKQKGDLRLDTLPPASPRSSPPSPCAA